MNSFKVWTCERRRCSRNDEKDYSYRGRERRGKEEQGGLGTPLPHSLNYWFHFHSNRVEAILTPNLLSWGESQKFRGENKTPDVFHYQH